MPEVFAVTISEFDLCSYTFLSCLLFTYLMMDLQSEFKITNKRRATYRILLLVNAVGSIFSLLGMMLYSF